MVKFKISMTVFVLILAATYTFYYFFQIGIKKDINKLVSSKITQNAFFIKEVMNKNKIKYESELNEWALTNKIAESLEDLDDYYIEKKSLEDKIKNFKEKDSSTSVKEQYKKDKKRKEKKDNINIEPTTKTKEELQKDLNELNNDISSLKNDLKNKFVYLTKTLKMNFHFLISQHLSKIDEINKNFKVSKEFIDAIQKGKIDSDIWMRKNFLYNVYGVPIKLNDKVLGTLFIGSKKTKKDADFLTERIKSKVAYINNNKVLSTNLYGNSIKDNLNKYIQKHKDELKTLTYNDISETFIINTKRTNYMAIFIPLNSYNEKVSGIIVAQPLSNSVITITTRIKYWIPIFSISIFFLVIIIIFIMNRNFLKPYIDLEIQTNRFLDEEDITIIPSEFGEADGLARSIKRLIKKAKGEKETYSQEAVWDDPLFVTELKKDDYSSKEKEKDHYDNVYKMFIRAHMNNGLSSDHIKKEDFKKRLGNIESRLKKKFKVDEIYFEVLIDESGAIKLHPKIVKKDGVS